MSKIDLLTRLWISANNFKAKRKGRELVFSLGHIPAGSRIVASINTVFYKGVIAVNGSTIKIIPPIPEVISPILALELIDKLKIAIEATKQPIDIGEI